MGLDTKLDLSQNTPTLLSSLLFFLLGSECAPSCPAVRQRGSAHTIVPAQAEGSSCLSWKVSLHSK